MARRIQLGLICALLAWRGLATEPEDELKAATVLAFLRHAEWENQLAGATLILGITGRGGILQALHRLEGKTANGRPIHVVSLRVPAECGACGAVYLAGDNHSELRQWTAALRRSGLLVIGENDRFLDMGGAVQLMIVQGHMSFEVSRSALDRAGVAISSKLLRYGTVRGGVE